jgi:hypothetical protein
MMPVDEKKVNQSVQKRHKTVFKKGKPKRKYL